MPLLHGLENTFGAGNAVTAPGSGSAFCSLTSPEAGVYNIKFNWILSGTAETLPSNVKLKWNALTGLSGLPSITGGGLMVLELPFVTLDGVNFVQLAATSAATAGATYGGYILATKIG